MYNKHTYVSAICYIHSYIRMYERTDLKTDIENNRETNESQTCIIVLFFCIMSAESCEVNKF